MKLLTLILLLFVALSSYGQITTTAVAEAPKAPEKKYDSTENFLGRNARQYIGQDLYLRGLPVPLRDGGYTGFILDNTKDEFDEGNTFKPNPSGVGSKYDELAAKYFTVLDVVPSAADEDKFFLTLQEKESKTLLYYVYDARYPNSFPFVTTGYFLKNKPLFIGKKFVVRGKNWMEGNDKPMLDMKTGLPVAGFEAGAVWTVVDLTVEEKYYTLALVLENEQHQQIPLNTDDLRDNFWAFTLEKAQEYQKKFGQTNWQLILNGKVQKGMNQEMCKIAWGAPKDVTTAKGNDGKDLELWSYDEGSLYFANGILFDLK
ncbi:MAG TPA: hypothetical protein VG738_15775 [Chitinophagaceae bacterium]|nr:hypothetical protein [Chitinophagaceae bacterium]